MDNVFEISTPAPTHHPPEEILIDYVSGAMSEAESMMIDLHLGACAQCRRTVQATSAIGGALLNAIVPAQLPRTLFDSTLRAIDALETQSPRTAVAPTATAAAAPDFAQTWPVQLRNHLASRPLPPWRRLPAGFRALRVPFEDKSSRVWIMKAPGGRGPLRHGHVCDEWTVVLEGGFSDETGTYAAGDFAYMGEGDQHLMVAEPGEGCVCVLLVRENPRYLTLVGKLLAPFLKL
jgi:putative transcriptional regulator